MYIQIIIPLLSGILLGIITGITPGIHINLITSLIIAYSYKILNILDPITITITITSMAVTHTILDIIPTTILGIPNTDNLTMLLPAHKLTSEGKAKLAILYGLLGAAAGIMITSLSIPLIIKIIPAVYEKIKDVIPYILILISAYIIIKSKNKFLSLVFFLAAGTIGILSFNIKTVEQPLLPLLTGLFGLSALMLSISNNIKLPEQKDVNLETSEKELAGYSLTTLAASLLTNFLPGITSSHTALIAEKITKIKSGAEHIIIANAANSSAAIISFIALYAINKTRSGAVAAIAFLIKSINIPILILIIAVSLITIGISTFFAVKISDKILKNISRINYKKLSITIIIFIIILIFIISKPLSMIILFTTTSLGILSQKFNVERIHLTGCLIFPVILYLL